MAESFGQLKQWRRIGVWPRGDQVRQAVGNREKPLSSTKTSVAFRLWALFSSEAKCAAPSAGWRLRRVRGHGLWASASSSRTGAAGGRHDPGHNEPRNASRADRRRVVWSTLRSRSHEIRRPAPTSAGAEPVAGGPASVDDPAAPGGATRRLRADDTAAPLDERPDGSPRVVVRSRPTTRRARCAARPTDGVPRTLLHLVACAEDTPPCRNVNLFIQRSLELEDWPSSAVSHSQRLRAACVDESSARGYNAVSG